MATLPNPRYTPQEYLEVERRAVHKSEYFAGEMFAMAGTSAAHSLIAANLIRVLGNQLVDRPCQVHTNDLRIKVTSSGLFTYPDVTIVCGEPEFEDGNLDTLLNPTVLIEVLSPSTEAYDRGSKFEHYRKLDSLREYVLIAQDHMHIEHYSRQTDGTWRLSESDSEREPIHLLSIGSVLNLAEVYHKVTLTGLSPKA